jgi:hypothetical protein
MKLKCNDGVIRAFKVAEEIYVKDKDGVRIYTGKYSDALCMNCGKTFGIHDTSVLKPIFKRHRCSNPERYRESMKPTPEQIKEQAEKLKQMKPKVRHWSYFGDNNWEQIDAQVAVLEGAPVSNYAGASIEVYGAAQDARSWMDGEKMEDGEDLVEIWSSLLL